MRPRHFPETERGFTLIEAVMVIVLTGVVAGIVGLIIMAPMRGYGDAVRRARLSDEADVATQRMIRELRLALPNSIRVTAVGTSCFIEMIPAIGGGRYRTQVDAAGNGDPLNFTATDTSFDVLGNAATVIPAGAAVVIYNLSPTLPSANAYVGDNRRAYAGQAAAAGGTGSVVTVTVASTAPFPYQSPGARFAVVDTPVTYEWNGAAGTILRHSGYGWSPAQPTVFGAGSLVVAHVGNAGCPFSYSSAVQAGAGLVSIALNLSDGVDSVFLLRQAHVDNVP